MRMDKNFFVQKKYTCQAYCKNKKSYAKTITAGNNQEALALFDNFIPIEFIENGYTSEVIKPLTKKESER